MSITTRDIGIVVVSLAMGAATTGIGRLVQQPQPTTPAAQTVQVAPQKRLTDFYLTQGLSQSFIYSESTRYNLGRGAMTFLYDGLDEKGHIKVYMNNQLLILKINEPTKFKYPYWEGGGDLTLLDPPSVNQYGKKDVYVEVRGPYLIRKWP